MLEQLDVLERVRQEPTRLLFFIVKIELTSGCDPLS